MHCYQEDYPTEELAFDALRTIVDQFKALILHYRQENRIPDARGHINVSGGEPFVRRDFFDLLKLFAENKEHFSYGILTNGSYIDRSTAGRLNKLGVANVQVSIEGSRPTNDEIRGEGAFENTVQALAHLAAEKVPSVISFTAHKKNYLEFMEVARVGRSLGVKRVWADRLIPYGNGLSMRSLMLSPEETRHFFEIMYQAHNETVRRFSRTEVHMHRALQFLVAGGNAYRCGAGETLITVLPNGDICPCRRMPIIVGNIKQSTLLEVYLDSPVLRSLRNKETISKGCEDCTYFDRCRGGLRCLSYALTGSPFNADPGCWRANRTDEEPFSAEPQSCDDILEGEYDAYIQ